MGRRDLVEARLARELRDPRLVRRIAIAVQEDDRDRAVAVGVRGGELAPCRGLVEWRDHVAPRADALLHLHHFLVEQLREAGVALEDARAGLGGEAQLGAGAARDEEAPALAL